MNSKAQRQDFPGGPVVRGHCRGHRFDLWSVWGIRSHMLGQCSQNFLNNNNKKLTGSKRTGVLEERQQAREAGMR